MMLADLSHLTRQQIGRVGEYMARTEFTRQGYTVYVPDVDDQGVDLLVYRQDRGYLRVQVKSLRGYSYVYMRKRHFQPESDLFLCLVLITGDQAQMFLVPAERWSNPCTQFVSKDYIGLKSPPEFGLYVTKRGMTALREYAFGPALAAA